MTPTAGTSASIPSRAVIVTTLGMAQILSWGTSFYFLAVVAVPIVRDTGWPYEWVIAGVSVGLVVAGFVSPRVGREIGHRGGRPVLACGAILFALGLALIGTSQNFYWYLSGWIVVGAGMGISDHAGDGGFAVRRCVGF